MPTPPARRKNRAAAAQQLGTWLAQVGGPDTSWNTLWPSLERQSALQADIDRFCDDVGCGRTLARETGNQQLAWFALSAAQAAKLRNLRVSLQTFLTYRGWQFTVVNIRTQPAKGPRSGHPLTPRKQARPGLTADQVALWETLEGGLDESPLRDAVAQLIAHHKRR